MVAEIHRAASQKVFSTGSKATFDTGKEVHAKLKVEARLTEGGPGRCCHTDRDLGTECAKGTQTVNPSSPVRVPTSQRGGPHVSNAAPLAREYRRERQHLYPLDDYQAALATGGTVVSFCGIEAGLLPDDADDDVVEVTRPDASDCITCVDVWRGRQLVRL